MNLETQTSIMELCGNEFYSKAINFSKYTLLICKYIWLLLIHPLLSTFFTIWDVVSDFVLAYKHIQ